MLDDNEQVEAPPRDRPFNPYRCPRSEKAKAIVADVTNQLQNYEKHRRPRKRARKPTDQAIFEETVSAVVCDLIHSYLSDPTRKVFVGLSNRSLGRKSRYRPSSALGKKLSALLESLSAPEMAFVEMVKGSRVQEWDDEIGVRYERKRTTLWTGPRLISRIEEHELDFDDLGQSEFEEIIILKAEKKHPKDNGQLMEYEDTPDTIRFRDELRAINMWLAEAGIELDRDAAEALIDTKDRRLRRIFNNGSFKRGGRLFGGFWQHLKKAKRRQDLVINGETAVELDYGQMALRLAYGMAGAVPPDGDLYCVPGLEPYRDGVKKVINAALQADKEQRRMPMGTRCEFPYDIEYKHAMMAISSFHAPMSHLFYQGVGMELMFRESEVLIALLLALKDKGEIALPIHDAVLVPLSSARSAQATMETVFKDKAGVDAVVRSDQG